MVLAQSFGYPQFSGSNPNPNPGGLRTTSFVVWGRLGPLPRSVDIAETWLDCSFRESAVLEYFVDLQVFTMKIPPLSLMCEDGAFGLDQQRTERSSESVCSQPPQNVRTPNISELSPVFPKFAQICRKSSTFLVFLARVFTWLYTSLSVSERGYWRSQRVCLMKTPWNFRETLGYSMIFVRSGKDFCVSLTES